MINFYRIMNLSSIKWSSSTYHMFKTTLHLPKFTTVCLQLYTEGMCLSPSVGFGFVSSSTQKKIFVDINLCSYIMCWIGFCELAEGVASIYCLCGKLLPTFQFIAQYWDSPARPLPPAMNKNRTVVGGAGSPPWPLGYLPLPLSLNSAFWVLSHLVSSFYFFF